MKRAALDLASTLACVLGFGACGGATPAMAGSALGTSGIEAPVSPQGTAGPAEPGPVEAEPASGLADQLVDAHDVRDLALWDGAVLVATAGGVLVFRDGVVSERWMARDGLLEQAVRALSVDPAGVVWLAFDGGGCQRRVQGRFESCPSTTEGLRITDFAVGAGGGVLALTWTGEVLPLSEALPARAAHVLPETSGGGYARAHRLERCQGATWVGSRGGGLAVRTEGGIWQAVAGQPIVESLACLADVLYVAGPEGVFRWDGDHLAAVPLSGPRRHADLVAALGGALLAGMADGSLWWIEGGSTQLVDLPGPAVAAVATPEQVWLGGPGGLYRLTGGPDGFLETVALPGPGSTDVSAVATGPGDRLALGLFRQGVALWDGSGWDRLDAAAGLPSNEVNGLAFDADGRLWIATSRGVGRADGSALTAVVGPPEIPCGHVNAVIYLAASRQVVAGTTCGVFWIDAASAQVQAVESTEEGLPHPMVYSLAEWGGALVAGTYDGLAIRQPDQAEQPWTVYRSGFTALRDNWITALAVRPDGTLAVGTYSGGLYVGASVETLRRVDGPEYVNTGALAESPGGLLIGGLSEGGYRLDATALEARPLGGCVPGPDVTGFAAWQGGMLVATRSGVAELPEACLGGTP